MYTVPDQQGRYVVITGANSGTGKEAAKRLAAAGAEVVMAVRTPGKGEQAREEILDAVPDASLEVRRMDLADLSSVRDFAEQLHRDGRPVDALVNNGGVMAVPDRMTTADGFELQLGTNFLGHFALTNLMLPLLLKGTTPLVATMSSGFASMGRIDFADINSVHRYGPWRAYAQSKLADMLLGLHLAAVATSRGWDLRSMVAHPGYTRTNLQTAGRNLGRSGRSGSRPGWQHRMEQLPIIPAQEVETGTEPLLFAVADPGAAHGAYYGPGGRFNLVGPTVRCAIPRSARGVSLARSLWAVAEDLTRTRLPT